MLQKLRDHAHGWWVYVVVPVLILLFAFWGIGSYLGGNMNQNEIAKVNGATVNYRDFSILFQQLNRTQNPNQNKALAGMIKMQVIQNLVNQELFNGALTKLGFSVSRDSIDALIAATPAFQEDGKFSMPKYNAVLQNLGISTEQLRQSLIKSYLIQQFQVGVISSNFALPAEVSLANTLVNQVRDVNYVSINPENFMGGITINDAEAKQFYQMHMHQFMSPYQVKLQYLMVSLDQFSKQYKDPNAAKAAYNNAVINLSDTSFQNPNSLEVSAHTLQQPIQSTDWLNTETKTGLLANPQVLAAVMSNSVLNQGNNSEVINLAPNQVIVLRVSAKQVPQQLPFSKVAAHIKNGLAMQQAAAKADELSKKVQAQLAMGQTMNQAAANYHLTAQTLTAVGQESKNISPEFKAAIVKAPLNQGTIAVDGANVLVFEVTKVYLPAKPAIQIPPQLISSLWAEIELGAYLSNLQSNAKIKLNDKLLQATT